MLIKLTKHDDDSEVWVPHPLILFVGLAKGEANKFTKAVTPDCTQVTFNMATQQGQLRMLVKETPAEIAEMVNTCQIAELRAQRKETTQ